MNTYFKSRQPSNPVVYVEHEDGWTSYTPSGVIQKNIGALPNYVRQHADELPFEHVVGLIRASEAVAEIKARELAFEPAGPSGIGGWLVLPVIGLCITAVWSLVDIARYLPGLWGAWGVLTDSASDAYHPLWGPYIGFASFVQFVVLLVPLFLLWLIGKRKRVLPISMIGFYVAVLFFTVIGFVAVVTFISQVMAEQGAASEASTLLWQSAQGLWKFMVFCGIWIPYFLFSKRVRNTFTMPWSDRVTRMQADARGSVIATLAAEKRAQREQASPEAVPAGDAAVATAVATAEIAAAQPAVDPSPAYWQQPHLAPSYWPPLRKPLQPRKIMLIPVVGVLVIVFGVVTGLAAWRDANPPQIKNPVTVSTDVNGNSTKHYSNGDFSYSFNYPADWVLQENSAEDVAEHSVTVYDPMGELIDQMSLDSATVGSVAFTAGGRSLAEVFADLKDGFMEGATIDGVTIDEPFTETSVGGLPAIKATCSSTDTDGTKLIALIHYAVGMDLLYYIELDYSGRPTDTSKAELEAIRASFKATP